MSHRVQRWALLGFLILIFCHGLGLTYRFMRDPSTLKNGFMYDHITAQHSLVLRNHVRVGGLPLTPEQRWTQLMPMDMPGESGWTVMDAALRNRTTAEEVYRNQLPIGYILNSIPALLLGLSFWTLRLGAFFPFVLLLFFIWDTGRKLHSAKAGLISTALIGFLPCVWQSLTLSKLGLTNMTLVAGVIWLLTLFMRDRVWAAVLLGVMIPLSTRGGEYVSDGLLCLAAILPVFTVVSVSKCWGGWQRRQIKPMVALLAVVIFVGIGVDWEWLSRHGSSYVVAESGLEQSGFNWGQWYWNLKSYLWMFQYSLFLPIGTVVLGVGFFSGVRQMKNPLVFGLSVSFLCGLFALAIPNKIQDYYLMPFVPALVLVAGLGLADMRKWGLGISSLGVVLLFVSYTQGMVFPDKSGFIWSFVDPSLKSERPSTIAQSWFSDWRWKEHTRQGSLRQKLAIWLDKDKDGWISQLSEKSVVVIPWQYGNQTYDGMSTLMMAYRPDVLLLNVDLNREDNVSREILRSVKTSSWLLVTEDGHRGLEQILSGWGAETIAQYPSTERAQLKIYKLDSQ